MELPVEEFNMGRLKFIMFLNNLLNFKNSHQLIHSTVFFANLAWPTEMNQIVTCDGLINLYGMAIILCKLQSP